LTAIPLRNLDLKSHTEIFGNNDSDDGGDDGDEKKRIFFLKKL